MGRADSAAGAALDDLQWRSGPVVMEGDFQQVPWSWWSWRPGCQGQVGTPGLVCEQVNFVEC